MSTQHFNRHVLINPNEGKSENRSGYITVCEFVTIDRCVHTGK